MLARLIECFDRDEPPDLPIVLVIVFVLVIDSQTGDHG
jgi:hypothetical protein